MRHRFVCCDLTFAVCLGSLRLRSLWILCEVGASTVSARRYSNRELGCRTKHHETRSTHTIMVLPAPDGPMMAVTLPARAYPETPRRMSKLARGNVLEGTVQLSPFQSRSTERQGLSSIASEALFRVLSVKNSSACCAARRLCACHCQRLRNFVRQN
jgi:hypothetical protein